MAEIITEQARMSSNLPNFPMLKKLYTVCGIFWVKIPS